MFRLRCYDHVTDAVAVLHWLHLPEQVNFKLAPVYLNHLVPVTDLPSRRRLRSSIYTSASSAARLTTIGRRSFPVAASIVWNTLPVHVQSSPYAAKDILVSSIIS